MTLFRYSHPSSGTDDAFTLVSMNGSMLLQCYFERISAVNTIVQRTQVSLLYSFMQSQVFIRTAVVIWIRSSTLGRLRSSGMRFSIFAPPNCRPLQNNWIGSKYIDSLLGWPPELVRMADGDVKQLIAPLIRVFLKGCYAQFRNHIKHRAVNDAGVGHLKPDRFLPHSLSSPLSG